MTTTPDSLRIARTMSTRTLDSLWRNWDREDFAGVAESAGALRTTLDVIERQAVEQLRERHGWTWQNIGDLYGISRQSAHERFGPRSAATPSTQGSDEQPTLDQ